MAEDDYQRVLSLLDSRLSLPLVYAACHEMLASRMPARNMFVCVVEQAGLRFPYYVDEQNPQSTLTIEPRRGWTAFILDKRDSHWLSADGSPGEGVKAIGTIPEDWIGIPFTNRDGVVLGALVVQTYEAGTLYSADDYAFVRFVASALSLAIQLALLDREIAIQRIAALVDETIDMDELYPKLHEIMSLVIPAARDNIIIARVDEKAGVFRPVYWRDQKDDYDSMPWPLSVGLSGHIYNSARSSYIFEEGRTSLPPGFIPIGQMPSHWLGAPLFCRDRIIGVVVIQSYDPASAITKEDEYALNGICPYIAATIGQTELFSRLNRPAGIAP
ncbi:MAG: hypothetical protein KKA67_01370 [Spirochaetes bacterium]|nr:hypothetical protein [Spirochaetota bacterium]MBU1079227.1 hypothetical protein [Spirochaetota bacterium]